MKRFFIIGIAWLLACPAFAQDPSANCFDTLETQYNLAPLRSLIALGNIKHQTLDMLTNTRHPSAAEKALIKTWVGERDKCFVVGDSWRQENMPANLRSVIESYYAKNKLLIADLYLSTITYGEFASKRARQSSDLTASLNEAWQANRQGRASVFDERLERQRAATRAAMFQAATKIFEDAASAPPQPVMASQLDCTGDPAAVDPIASCR